MSTESSSLADAPQQSAFPSLPVAMVGWLIVMWLIGVQSVAGWQHSTEGISNYPKAMVGAIAFDVLFIVGLGIVRGLKIKSDGVSRRMGFAFGLIFFLSAFPVFAALGGIWNAIGGTYPDPTGFPKIVSEVMIMR